MKRAKSWLVAFALRWSSWLLWRRTVFYIAKLTVYLVRKVIDMLSTLWNRVNGKEAMVRLVTAIVGLTFKQFMFTDQQLGDSLKAAVVEHDQLADPTIPDPTYPLPEADWEDFASGLALLGDEIRLLFSLPETMVWEMFSLCGDRFLARVAA